MRVGTFGGVLAFVGVLGALGSTAFAGAGCSATAEAPIPSADGGPLQPVDGGAPWTLPFPVVPKGAGPVIQQPSVIPVFFGADTDQAAIEGFHNALARESSWLASTREYGVGPLQVKPSVVLAKSGKTTSDSAIVSLLQAELSKANSALGAPDSTTLYALYYPATTVISDSDGSKSCADYDGYHSEFTVGATKVAYAVMPRCGTLDDLASTASHELFEWATDPFPDTAPGYADVAAADWIWAVAYGGELSDLCTFSDDYGNVSPTAGLTLQRQWSNARAAAGRPPCLPTSDQHPYFVAAPAFSEGAATDPLRVTAAPWTGRTGPLTATGLRIPAGSSRTIPTPVYAEGVAPGDRWTLSAEDANDPALGFSAAFDATEVTVGDRPSLTVTAPAKSGAYTVLLLKATRATPNGAPVTNSWPLLVFSE